MGIKGFFFLDGIYDCLFKKEEAFIFYASASKSVFSGAVL